jgi:hypothetical protein
LDFIEIEILNWEKHQPRKDIKHPTWFALDNRILEDAKLFGLSAEEWKALLYVFCQASQQNSAKVKINHRHASKVCDVQKKSIDSLIRTLPYVIRTDPYASVRDPNADVTRHYTTLQDTTLQNTNARPYVERVSLSDLNSVYQGYPRKEGKSRGLSKLRTSVRDPADLIECVTARDNFVAHHKRLGTESRFIPHFSTWAGSWRDWLDPNHGQAESFAPKKKTTLELIEETMRGIGSDSSGTDKPA